MVSVVKHTRLVLLFLCASFILAGGAHGQEIPRDEYLKYVPLTYPRLVQQTAATDALHLYGDQSDPAWRDVDPVDGIDDARHEVLMALAVRFAPYLVQNTTNIPTNFETYIENSGSFPLFVDTWDLTGHESRLIRAEGIELEDDRLLELLEQFTPREPREPAVRDLLVQQRPDLFKVLFFDFPGEGPGPWQMGYAPEYQNTPGHRQNAFPHSFIHPFLSRADDGDSVPRYELVLQYWFYYPSNDGGNNHEGDWEHLNVVIAPLSVVGRPLTAGTVERILTGDLPASGDAAEPLVIRRVEYYFHHFVMTLDFTAPDVYQSRDDWKKEVKSRPELRFQERDIWKAIRHMAYRDDTETQINTHPFGYIGADNKGFDQALSAPGGKNRNSHGTFPFPGRYHNIGPAGATEQVSVHVDSRQYWKKLKEGKVTEGPEFKRGSVIGLADPDRLRIIPDWERIVDKMFEDAVARRDWSWMVLPIRWGYPATESPFSGIIDHTDTGNLAPVGPAYSSGWNVTGAATGFHTYEPNTLVSVFPLGLQDSFRNDFGFFTFTLPVLFNLPPLDFLTRIASYPLKLAFGRRDPVYYPKQGVPFRFFGLSSGISVQIFHEDFNALALNPDLFDEFILRPLFHFIDSGGDTTTVVTDSRDFQDNSVGSFFQVAFYIGGHFASENTVRNSRSTFGLDLEFNNIPSYSYSAEINYWEYAGSIRYSISSSRLQPFIKGGYGWSWYRLENIQANGEPFDRPESEWIKPNSIWPNVWHIGLGMEFIPWRRVGKFPGGMELALRFEYGYYTQHLGLDLSEIPLEKLGLLFSTLGDIPGSERVSRHDFLFGMTLSF